MREPHYGHAGTVYDGKMYISGGITHDSFQKELLCYDPAVDSWEQKTPMTGNVFFFEFFRTRRHAFFVIFSSSILFFQIRTHDFTLISVYKYRWVWYV